MEKIDVFLFYWNWFGRPNIATGESVMNNACLPQDLSQKTPIDFNPAIYSRSFIYAARLYEDLSRTER